MSTINLIDSLNPKQKKCLNDLVLSVLRTQKDNEEEKLKLINLKRDVIKQQQLAEQEKLEYERQKISLFKLMKANSVKLKIVEPSRVTPKSKKTIVRRYRIEKDGTKTLISS